MYKIAVIGASYLQKPLVLKANEMGMYTICFSWEDGAVCKDICHEFHAISITEKELILAVCKKLKIDAILSISSDVAVTTVNYIAHKLGLIGNSIECSQLSTNKVLMRNKFYRSGIRIPAYIKMDSLDSLNETSNLQFPLIVKPVDRSGSKGITVVHNEKKLKKAVSYALKESFVSCAIVEEFIIGEEISVESISNNGNHEIITFTDKITSGFPHYVELEHHQPSKFLNSKIKNLIKNIVYKGLNSLNIEFGASHSELIITKENKIYLTEIGARMGGDFIGSNLVYLSTGYDYLKSVINLSLRLEPLKMTNQNYYSGIYFYTEQRRFVQEYIEGKNDSIIQFELFELTKTKLKQSSDRSGYFIYKSIENRLLLK